MCKPASDEQIAATERWANGTGLDDDLYAHAQRMLALLARIKLADALEEAAEALLVHGFNCIEAKEGLAAARDAYFQARRAT